MKKIIFAVLCFMLGGISWAAFNVTESPILGSGTPGQVYVSTTTLTKVPPSQTSGRLGVYLSIQSTGTLFGFAGHFGDCTSAPSTSVFRPVVIATQSQTASVVVPIREDVCLWLISMDVPASTTTVLNYQEIKK